MKKLLTLMFVLVAFIFCARSVKAQQSISPKIINLETIYTGEPLSFDFILTNNSDVTYLIRLRVVILAREITLIRRYVWI